MREQREERRERGEGRTADASPRWRRALNRASRVVRQIFGMPDYERYLAHRHQCHPGEPVLGPKAFYAQQIEQRYAGGTGRCC